MSDVFNVYPDAACHGLIQVLERKMATKGIPITGVKLTPEGKLEKKPGRMSVSAKIRQRKSKKVRPTKRVKGAQRP